MDPAGHRQPPERIVVTGHEHETRAAPDEPGRPVNRGWYLLLLLPFVALLWLPFYAREEPRLLDFPFFYWYQLLWVFLGAAITGLVYRMTTREEAPPVDRRTLGDELGTRRGLYRRGGRR